MIELMRFRLIIVPIAVVVLVITFGLIAVGVAASFAHICGYTAGFFTAIILFRRVKYSDGAAPDAIFCVLAYVIAFAVSLSFVSLEEAVGINSYIAALAAIPVFVGLLWLSLTIIARSRLPLPEALSATAARARTGEFSAFQLLSAGIQLIRHPQIGRIVFASVVLVFVLIDLRSSVYFYRSAGERAAVPVYGRVDSWINAAECFAKTGVIFARCAPSGNLEPLEDATIADDRGHAFMLSVLHRWFGVPATKLALVFVNAGFSLIAFALLAWQFIRCGRVLAAVVIFGMTVQLLKSGYFSSDAPSAYYAVFALSILLPFQILRMFSIDRLRAREWVWLTVAGIALVVAYLVREPMGMIGVLLTVLAVLIAAIQQIRRIRPALFVVIAGSVIAILLAVNIGGLLTDYRIHYQGVPAGKGIISHGIAHNLYIGLGSDPNPFGIQWSDTSGADAVKAVDPTIAYGSERYFSTLEKLYFDVVREHPFAVARIYASRVGRVLGPFILPGLAIGFGAILAGLSLLRSHRQQTPYGSTLVTFSVVVAIGSLLHAAQAVLTVPISTYYFQADLGIYILAAIASDIWFRAVWGNVFERNSSS